MKNIKKIKNEIVLREEYEAYVKEAQRVAVMDNFSKLMMKDIQTEEDHKITNMFDTEKSYVKKFESIFNNYLKPKVFKTNILSFEEWVKKYK